MTEKGQKRGQIKTIIKVSPKNVYFFKLTFGFYFGFFF